MAIASTSEAGSVSSLAQELFKRIDVNRDGHLTTNEFQKFLEGLIQAAGVAGQQTSKLLSVATATADDPRVYQPMLGFSYTKLNTQTHTTPKYVFARATQDLELGWDRASRSTGLDRIVDRVRENGYPDAKVTGDDTIDFGDGYGNIDVLTADGQWWWGPEK